MPRIDVMLRRAPLLRNAGRAFTATVILALGITDCDLPGALVASERANPSVSQHDSAQGNASALAQDTLTSKRQQPPTTSSAATGTAATVYPNPDGGYSPNPGSCAPAQVTSKAPMDSAASVRVAVPVAQEKSRAE